MKIPPHLPISVRLKAVLAFRRFRLAATLLIALPCAFVSITAVASQEPTAAPAQPSLPTPGPQQAPNPPSTSESGEITEDELKQRLVGKQLFLRGGYLGDSLSFTEHGLPVGHPSIGSYTLSGVQIEKVRLTKHKVELEGDRYALHFLGALPYENSSNAIDRIKITPKKKVLKITIDREQLVKEKKSKEEKKEKGTKPSKTGPSPADLVKENVASSETDVATPNASPAPPAQAVPVPSAPAQPAPAQATPDQAAAPETEDKAADQASVTSTTSPMHAAHMLREALDRIFATGLDDKIKAQMPAFWQLYYQAQAAGVDYRPRDPSILRSSAVDQQAKVLTSIAPDSNEYAQASGISGQALYRVVIGTDGKPDEIAVERPIGFGLDEKAVEAIRKATFEPAQKAGQPVAETLDLAVLFRIYSKRTSVSGSVEAKPGDAIKPGPYSVSGSQGKPQ